MAGLDDFVRMFADEANGRLERMQRELMDLESRPSDTELVKSIFRDAHTIKGGAGMVGLEAVGKRAHRLEDVLADLRSGAYQATPEMVDMMLSEVAILREMIARPGWEPPPMAEPQAVAEPEPQAEPQAVSEREAQVNLEADEEAEIEPAAEPEPQAEPGSQAEPEPEVQAVPEAEPEPEAEPPAERVAEPEAGPEPDAQAEPASEALAGPEPEVGSESEAEPEPELGSDAQSETVAEPEAQPQSEAELPVAVEPDVQPSREGLGQEQDESESLAQKLATEEQAETALQSKKKVPAPRPSKAPRPSLPAPASPVARPSQPAIPIAANLAAPKIAAAAPTANVGSRGEPPVPAPAAASRPPVPATAGDGDSIVVARERLDDIIRLVGEAAAAHLRMGRVVEAGTGQDPSLNPEYRGLTNVINQLQELTMRARMVSIASVAGNLQVAIRQLARSTGKRVVCDFRGEDTELDRSVLDRVLAALIHVVRNAVDHGIELPAEREAAGKSAVGHILIHAMPLGPQVVVSVTDDGRGIDVGRLRKVAQRMGMDVSDMSAEDTLNLIYRSGVSTAEYVTDVSGRGVGMDAVRSNIEAVRGNVDVRSQPGRGTEFRISVPVNVTIVPCMLLLASGQRLAIPLNSVTTILSRSRSEEQVIGGHRMVTFGEYLVPLAGLSEVLSLGGDDSGEAVVISGVTRSHAFRVERVLGQRDVVFQSLGTAVPPLAAIAGASVEPDGSVLIVLEPRGLIDLARKRRSGRSQAKPVDTQRVQATRQAILVVDDALAVREMQRAILERAGYLVRTATDGAEALAVLGEQPFDMVLTDVEMPNLDGFGLTEAIRKNASLANTPVVILTSRATDEDRRRGLDAGADGYITKQSFDEKSLISVVERLLGRHR